MAARIFNNFKLFFRVFCVDCKFAEELSFHLGNLFNLEGDFILETNEEIYVSNRSCKRCGCFYYLEFKKIFSPVKIREIYDGIKILESEIVDNVPKGDNYSYLRCFREIVLSKDEDFHFLFVEIDFSGYYKTYIRLWPEDHVVCNSPSQNSDDSGVDCCP